MARAKLDRSRPFGTVYGGADYVYEQDDKRFDGAGNEVVTQGAPRAAAPGPAQPQEPQEPEGFDEGLYAGWKLPALKREVADRTGKKVQGGVGRENVIRILQDLDSAGTAANGADGATDDADEGDGEAGEQTDTSPAAQ